VKRIKIKRKKYRDVGQIHIVTYRPIAGQRIAKRFPRKRMITTIRRPLLGNRSVENLIKNKGAVYCVFREELL
jgi:hypothetical protein